MRHWIVGLAILSLSIVPTAGQAPSTYKAPRSPFKDGKPDLSGIWQANNTANWDIQGHAARQGPILELGAAFSIPAGLGVVEGDEIPYQPWAAAKKKENAANWLELDPEIKCYMPGVPRANYMPYPFQIVQTPTHILMAYEFASASRTIYMNSKEESPADTWMGWSRGRWEGDTLVVDVNAFNGQTWFDRAGNFHSEALHVVERYTPVSRDVLQYDVTIEDPKVFTRPWKMSMPLYRRAEKNAQLLEYKCVEFVEELMYGNLQEKAVRRRRCRPLIAMLLLTVATVAGQERKAQPRTPWGDPDLQGIWSIATITPFERPSALAGKAQLTEQEAAEAEKTFLDDPESGSPRRCGHRCRRRSRLQRFLVGSRNESRVDAPDVARRRSAGRASAGADR